VRFHKHLLFFTFATVSLVSCKKSSPVTPLPPDPNPDVYVAGYLENNSTYHGAVVYWKNNTIYQLTDTAAEWNVTDMVLNGTDVYISGFLAFGHPSISENPVTYWKNRYGCIYRFNKYNRIYFCSGK
jgi:hypothetical protein